MSENNTEKQKIILITGSSTGLGRAMVELLASSGELVYAGVRKDIDFEEIGKTKNVKAVKLDVTNVEQIKDVIKQIENEEHRLDVLINNAGIAMGGPLVDFQEGNLKQIFDVNVFGPFRMSKEAFPLLERSNNPMIVNVSSTAARHALPFIGPYAMTKFSLEAFSDSLRRELQPFRIKIVIIQPGKFKTPIWEKSEKMLDEFESSKFGKRAIPLIKKSMKKGREEGQDPNKVAEVVYKAIHSKKPKIRYHLPKGRLRAFILDKLPARWVDWIISKK